MGALERNLQEAGLADTAFAIDATIRPATFISPALDSPALDSPALDSPALDDSGSEHAALDHSVAETLARPAAAALARQLPRLSVDLREHKDAVTPRSPGQPPPDFEVRGLIGEGGMGRVLLVRQHSLARDVAVKTAKEGATEAIRNALLVEGAITGRLEHPGIVPVHALGLDREGRPVMVMKRIEGVAWRELARDPTHPGWEGWPGDDDDRLLGHLQILLQLCNAVHFAHSRGIVHRDIKPENVLIGRFGDVYLADWGIATEIGETGPGLCGTPGYMAPEMVDGKAVDERTDVYLLGATLHEALTGKLRHEGEHAMAAVLKAKLSTPHDYTSEVPEALGVLINRACHVDPEERQPGASALREAVVRYIEHRASAELAVEAIDRLERLEPLVAAAEPDEEQRAQIDRLIAESSFAFERALAEWPGDQPTLEAQQRLMDIQKERRARAAALEREAHERDPMIGTTSRAIALTALTLVGMAIAWLSLVNALRPPNPYEVLAYPLAVYALVVIGTVAMRKRLLATRFNRQALLLVHILMVLICLGRALGIFVDIELAVHFARDSFMLAGGFAVAAIAYRRWTSWIALVFFVSFVLCTLLPEHSLIVFVSATTLGTGVGAGLQWADRRRGLH